MGDRAVLTFSPTLDPKAVGVYLHWSGDPECVRQILQSCRDRGYRLPADDPPYAMARLIEACCDFDGHGKDTGVGVSTLDDLDCDNSDNGTYVIGGKWEVISRAHQPNA